MMKKATVVLCLALGALLISATAQDEETTATPETLSGRPLDFNNLARLPYQHLIKIAQSDARSDKDAEEYRLRIQSRNSSVKSKDIELFLDLEEGPLVLVVDNDGFVTVPFREDLIESNPDLVANQPRGSLNIYVELEVPKVTPPEIKDGKVTYQELFRPLVEIQNEMRKVDPTFGLSGQQFVLEIETGEEPIKITRALGSRTFRPNSRGKVYMIMESYLYEENPEVEIPNEVKMNVLPATEDEINDIRSR
ncbi:MAG: hypothetical protein P1U81_02660 [Verrucomicrobiales bacterium]|nr:hypothetical protein [Verrucomicrobiales bacterium]